MANEERGEVELVAGEDRFTLCLSMNAICRMQTRTKKTYGELLQSMRNLDIAALRDIVWMTLEKYHKDTFPNPEKVGDLIDRSDGGVSGTVETLNRLFTLNQERGKANADPPIAQT